jgi:hypothetical protein
MTRLGYRFTSHDRPLRVASDLALEPQAKRFWRGWPFARDAAALDRPDIIVAALPAKPADRYADPRDDWGGGFRLSHASIEGGFMDCPTAEETANQLAGVLVAAEVRARPAVVAVHAAACRTPAGLVVLPGASMSGKSTLSLQLMVKGGRLFGDDRVLLDPGAKVGEALGLTPRVRLPVPAGAGPALARLAAERGTADGTVAWLDLEEAEAASFGERSPIAAFAAPERVEAGPLRLEETSGASMVRALLDGAVTGESASAAALASVAALVSRTPCWRLAWRDSAEAGALLWQHLTQR